MDVTCERCHTEYEFDDALVSEQGTSVRCTQCGHRFKVKRPTGGAPEIWIVRTVDGQAMEFRALRELKSAISIGKVGRDDVLSRGSGRPRRLASIAELEPFFIQTPSPMSTTKVGLGIVESKSRARSATPSGLGPVSSRTENSVAIPLPTREDRGPISVNVPPPTPVEDSHGFDDEVTRSRQLTKELHTLGETPPESIEPTTIFEPDRFPSEDGPKTITGVAPKLAEARARGFLPDDRPPASVTKTSAFGTPASAGAASAGPSNVTSSAALADTAAIEPPDSSSEPTTARRVAAAPPPVEPRREVPNAAPEVPRPAPSNEGERAQVLPPEPSAEAVAAATAAAAAAPATHGANGSAAASEAEEDEDVEEGATPEHGRGGKKARPRHRVSLVTPTPADTRYSAVHDEADVMPSERRTSLVGSRRSAGSTRLIVGLLVGGVMIFGGILLVQRYVKKGSPQQIASADPRMIEFLDAGDKAMKEGDLKLAQEQFMKASGLAEKDPRVLKALARLEIVQAEIAWLRLLILPAKDAAREAAKEQYDEATKQAISAVDRAAEAASDDADVALYRMDLLRIQGRVPEARKLIERLSSIDDKPETKLSKAALDLSEQKLQKSVVDRLAQSSKEDGGSGRARALLVYALAREGEVKRARDELTALGKLTKKHPLFLELTRFLERAESGENVALRVEDLPTEGTSPVASSSASAEPVEPTTLKQAQEALQKGELQKAESLYDKVLASEGNNFEALMGRAAVAQKQGQGPLAAQYYQRAVDANPNSAQALLNLADLKWKNGDQGAARSLYRKALEHGLSGEAASRAHERVSGSETATGPTPPPPPPPTTVTSTTAPPPPTPPPPPTSDVPPWDGDGN